MQINNPPDRRSLPIDEVLTTVVCAAQAGGFVLVAPPGAGKTTRVGAALIEAMPGEVWVVQPRRVAARAAARRIAQERGDLLGEVVGYQVRFDRKGSVRTRLWVMTEGIALRRLQSDPFLTGVSAVILDEFHERSLQADLLLALLAEVRREVAPALCLGVMSATMDPAPVAAFLDDVAQIRSAGRVHPVEVRYRPDAPLLAAVREGLSHGDVLVFLPGVREIRRAADDLRGIDADVLLLHGRLSARQQDAALSPGSGPRVILATNLAETSVTVPGVRAIVDTGLVRRPRLSLSTGLDRLEVEQISAASADQRAGRAGRTAPGICIRLWSERVQHSLDTADPPAIHRVDLAGAVQQLRSWGADPDAFGWFDPPVPARLAAAERLLDALGADADLARLPVHPRLGRLVIEAHRGGHGMTGALLAAMLSESDPFRGRTWPTGTSDLLARVDALRGGDVPVPVARRLQRVADQLLGLLSAAPHAADRSTTLGRAVLAAWPDRLCRRRTPGAPRARMIGGRGVIVGASSAVRDAELFVAVDVDDVGADALVRIASAVDPAWLTVSVHDELTFDAAAQAVRARRVRAVGDLVLGSQPIEADPQAAAALLAEHARKEPQRTMPTDTPWEQLLARLEFAARHGAFPAPDPASWLDLLCHGRRSFAALRRADWPGAVRTSLGERAWSRLQKLAPPVLRLTSGRRARLTYRSEGPPVLATRIQDLFGTEQTPTVAGVPVLVHLLAPNGRPQQITNDLAGFWERTWPEVRRELRARYPKHAWPEHPHRR